MKLLLFIIFTMHSVAAAAKTSHLLRPVQAASLQALRSYVPLASRARWARGSLGVREYVGENSQMKRRDLAYKRLEKGMIYLHKRSITELAPLLNLTAKTLQRYVELEKAIDKFARLTANDLAKLTKVRRKEFENALHQQRQAKQWAIKSPKANELFKSLMRVEASALNSYDHPSSTAIIKSIGNAYEDVSAALGYSWLAESGNELLVPSLLPSLEFVENFAQKFADRLNGYDLLQIAHKDLVIRSFRILQRHEPESIDPVLQEYLVLQENFAANNYPNTNLASLRQHLENLTGLAADTDAYTTSRVTFAKALANLSEHIGSENVIDALTSNPPTVATMMRTARGDKKLRMFATKNLGYSYLSRLESGKRLASAKVLPLISDAYGIDLYELRKSMLVEKTIRAHDYAGDTPSAVFGEDLFHALAIARANRDIAIAKIQAIISYKNTAYKYKGKKDKLRDDPS